MDQASREDLSSTADEARTPYNDGFTHEALHTAHVLTDTWYNHVFNTRCADEFHDVKIASSKALDAMGAVYQLLGSKFSDDEPSPNAIRKAKD